MHRINDNSLLVFYENGKGDILSKRSLDEGVTWSVPNVAYESYFYENQKQSTKINIANPEFIQLKNNDLLLACNLRPAKNDVYPFSIAVKRSIDEGYTWETEQVIYKAHNHFRDGCWEPAFLALPDGTLQIYYANEFPYTASDEQEISMLSSSDNGVTWTSKAKIVSFRKNHRDGMPVPVLDGKNIALAIEDNIAGQFQPFIVIGKINDNWTTHVTGESDNRHFALTNPLPEKVYAGAPYLIKTDIGLYILSYQTTENRTDNWEQSTMEVVVSKTTSNFKNPSHPFNVPLNKEAKWNSLTDLGKGEIAALSSTNLQSQKIGVWMIKGKILKK
ncbi:MAG: exo-alpha-sialidase [Candidatus Saccharimonadaceae bacterium]